MGGCSVIELLHGTHLQKAIPGASEPAVVSAVLLASQQSADGGAVPGEPTVEGVKGRARWPPACPIHQPAQTGQTVSLAHTVHPHRNAAVGSDPIESGIYLGGGESVYAGVEIICRDVHSFEGFRTATVEPQYFPAAYRAPTVVQQAIPFLSRHFGFRPGLMLRFHILYCITQRLVHVGVPQSLPGAVYRYRPPAAWRRMCLYCCNLV